MTIMASIFDGTQKSPFYLRWLITFYASVDLFSKFTTSSLISKDYLTQSNVNMCYGRKNLLFFSVLEAQKSVKKKLKNCKRAPSFRI